MENVKWYRVDTGWYHTNPLSIAGGAVVQRWWRAEGSPGGKAGWYAWKPNSHDADWTWHRTMREAKQAALDGERKP